MEIMGRPVSSEEWRESGKKVQWQNHPRENPLGTIAPMVTVGRDEYEVAIQTLRGFLIVTHCSVG
jgi:hypothetical protein